MRLLLGAEPTYPPKREIHLPGQPRGEPPWSSGRHRASRSAHVLGRALKQRRVVARKAKERVAPAAEQTPDAGPARAVTEQHSLDDVAAAVELAFERGSPRHATIKTLLRVVLDEPRVVEPVSIEREDLAAIDVAPADLALYDSLAEVA